VSSPSFDDRYDEPDRLRDQLRQLLRYRTTIVLGVALGLLGGLLLVLFRAGTYTSTSEVLVRSTTDPFSTFGVSADNQVSMGTERQIALSATVAARAARGLDAPAGAAELLEDLRVTNPPDTRMLMFAYTADTPERAARLANAFAEAYLADRKDRTDAAVKRMSNGLEQQIAVLAEQKAENDKAATAAGQRDRINALQKRLSDIRSYDTTGGDVVRRAEPPARPSGPGPAWLVGLGLLSGLLGGIVLAWVRAALEPRVRSVSEVQAALGAPVLGIIPGPGTKGDPLVVGRGCSSRAEAYRILAFRLRHGEGCLAGGSLLIVAPREDRNAEAAAVNLAAAFAEFGDDVLLVDGGASTPGVCARLPLMAGAAGAPEGGVVVDAGTAGRFTLFPDRRGATPGDDVPVSPAVTRALPHADSATSALVITRPLLEHVDGLTVAQRVDGVLVVGGDHTKRDDLKRMRELISCSGGHIVGAVLDSGTARRRLRLLPKREASANPDAPAHRSQSTAPGTKPPTHPQEGTSVQDDTLTASR
jgi:capsular polysaccharide biosynthesis protein